MITSILRNLKVTNILCEEMQSVSLLKSVIYIYICSSHVLYNIIEIKLEFYPAKPCSFILDI